MTNLRQSALIMAVCLMAALCAAAQRPVALATRVNRPPRMDGTLDDPLWGLGRAITQFKQIEPLQGEAPSERTEVRILYTRRAVYVGVRCYDIAPGGIIATQLRRDMPQELDDHFEILIDPTDNGRDAYVFEFNPLGAQSQGTITNEQGGNMGDYQLGWDGIWSVQTRIGSEGWSATVEIPFSNLNLMKSTKVVWGLNFQRFIRRKNETDLWAAYRREYGFTKVSEAGMLRGITDIGGGRLVIVKPYGAAGVDRLGASAAGPARTRDLTSGGVGVKLGLRSNLVANLVLNPDFGEAEVDQQQFNLTPYAISYPETREFFLENSNVFNFATGNDQLFYSRQIGIDPVSGAVVPIVGGAKVSGTLGPYQLGWLDVQTRPGGGEAGSNYDVLSAKRALFGQSYIGVMGTERRSPGGADAYNRAGGVDGQVALRKNLIVSGFAAGSQSPGALGSGSDVGGQIAYTTEWLKFRASRDRISPNYNPEVGFVSQTGINDRYAELELAPHPGWRGVRELNFEAFVDSAPDYEGNFLNQEWQGTFRLYWNNGAYTDDDLWDVFTQRIVQPFTLVRNVVIAPGLYHFARHQITFGSRQDRAFNYSLYERFGSYYDGRLNESRLRVAYRPDAHWSLAGSALWDRFSLPQGRFSVELTSAEADYAWNRSLTASALVQSDTANPQALSVFCRVRYHYRPDSDFYFILSHGTAFASIAAGNPVPARDDRIEVKLTRSLFTGGDHNR